MGGQLGAGDLLGLVWAGDGSFLCDERQTDRQTDGQRLWIGLGALVPRLWRYSSLYGTCNTSEAYLRYATGFAMTGAVGTRTLRFMGACPCWPLSSGMAGLQALRRLSHAHARRLQVVANYDEHNRAHMH